MSSEDHWVADGIASTFVVLRTAHLEVVKAGASLNLAKIDDALDYAVACDRLRTLAVRYSLLREIQLCEDSLRVLRRVAEEAEPSPRTDAARELWAEWLDRRAAER